MKIACLTRKPDSPSYDVGYGKLIPLLKPMGYDVTTEVIPKGYGNQRRFFKGLSAYDLIWWHRHLIAPLSLKSVPEEVPILYQYDDPITLSSENEGQVSKSRLKRFSNLVSRATLVVASSEHLSESAKRFAKHPVRVINLAIDLPFLPDDLDLKRRESEITRIVWMGSRATQAYMYDLRATLEKLGSTHQNVELLIVGHEPMDFSPLPTKFLQWTPDTGLSPLFSAHIGLCPMPDNPWTQGKCPYKVVQYMSCRLPWISAALGENKLINQYKAKPSGFCCVTPDDWYHAITQLIQDPELRETYGEHGALYVKEQRETGHVLGQLTQAFDDTIAIHRY